MIEENEQRRFIGVPMSLEEAEESFTEYDKAIKNRLSRATGHLRSVKSMVESGRDCTEILIQLSAVKSEINSTSREIMKQYMSGVIDDAAKTKQLEKIKELSETLDLLL